MQKQLGGRQFFKVADKYNKSFLSYKLIHNTQSAPCEKYQLIFSGFKVTPPSSFDDLADEKQDIEQPFLGPKSDEQIIRDHISAKNKGKHAAKETKRGGGQRPSSAGSGSQMDSAKIKGPSLDLDLPPPPSPPCTCGKDLPVLPPESILQDMNLMQGYMGGKFILLSDIIMTSMKNTSFKTL